MKKTFFALLLLLPAAAFAQTLPLPPDTTRARVAMADTVAAQIDTAGVAAPAPAYTLTYTGTLSGAYGSGAVERLLISSTHAATWTRGHVAVPLNATYAYGKQDGTLRERELGFVTTPTGRIGHYRVYGTLETQTSNLRGISARFLFGAGIGYSFFTRDSRYEVALSNLVLHENTVYLDGSEQRVYRNSTRLKLRLPVSRLSLTSQSFYQPAFRSDNYRISSTSTLSLPITAAVAAVLTHTFTYESVVFAGRSRGNTNATVGVTCTFK